MQTLLTGRQKRRILGVAAVLGVPAMLLAAAAVWLSAAHVQISAQPAAGYVNENVFVSGFVVNVGGQQAAGAVFDAIIASRDGHLIAESQSTLGDIAPQGQTPFYVKVSVPTTSTPVLVVQSSISWTESRPFLGSRSFHTSLATLTVEKFKQPTLDPNVLGSSVAPLAISPIAKILTGPHTDAITYGFGYVWTTNSKGNSITRIDPSNNRIHLVTVGTEPMAIAAGFGSIWVGSTTERVVWRLDPATEHFVTIQIGGYARFLAVDAQDVWVGTNRGSVQKIDPYRNQIVGTAQVGIDSISLTPGDDAVSVAPGDGSIWVSVYRTGIVGRVDPLTMNVVARVQVGDRPGHLAVHGTAVWVPTSSSLVRIDPAINEVAATIAVGLSASSVTIDGDSLWITSATGPYIIKADALTGRPSGYLQLDTDSTQAVLDAGSLWVLHTSGPDISSTATVPSTVDRINIA